MFVSINGYAFDVMGMKCYDSDLVLAFMYLTDFHENTLQDVIAMLEPDLFMEVTGLTVKDFHPLASS
jgi:hypothetical protein